MAVIFESLVAGGPRDPLIEAAARRAAEAQRMMEKIGGLRQTALASMLAEPLNDLGTDAPLGEILTALRYLERYDGRALSKLRKALSSLERHFTDHFLVRPSHEETSAKTPTNVAADRANVAVVVKMDECDTVATASSAGHRDKDPDTPAAPALSQLDCPAAKRDETRSALDRVVAPEKNGLTDRIHSVTPGSAKPQLPPKGPDTAQPEPDYIFHPMKGGWIPRPK